jgi:hypothetical protein
MLSINVQLTDQDILVRLAAHEDSFVERKTVNDLGDCLKTVVAFANTAPVGYPAILFVGVRNNGDVEEGVDLDKIQRSLSQRLSNAYPPIYTLTRVLQRDGNQFLAVIIPGSDRRPHFAGQAYIRDGSQSVVASEAQFTRLITDRNSTTYEIRKWITKTVTVQLPTYVPVGDGVARRFPANVVDCNQFYVTVESVYSKNSLMSFSLINVQIGFDHPERRLELVVLA